MKSKNKVLSLFIAALLISLCLISDPVDAWGEDDYPSELKDLKCGDDPDYWDFYVQQCTSFVAWRMNRDHGEGSFTNHMHGGTWGDANNWYDNARKIGIPVYTTPRVGAIAQWDNPMHVAYVESVNVDGSVNISEYNWESECTYGERSNVSADHYIHFHTKLPVAGDWNGDGKDTFGRYYNNTFYLDNGRTIPFGIPGDLPVTGDWDGDGDDNIGVFRPKEANENRSTFYLDLQNDGTADWVIAFGFYPEDIPISGDWDGDGDDDIGGYYPSNSKFYLFTISGFTAIPYYVDPSFGLIGDIPVIGDWEGDGDDDVGVYRYKDPNPNTNSFYLDLNLTGGRHELGNYALGNIADVPITGDWDRDGADKVGVYRPLNDTFYPRPDIPPE